jgi:hypothetical protein
VTATLGILIATIPRRRHYLTRLMERLTPQLTDDVRVRLDADEHTTIGGKRQRLLSESAERFLAWIDDDDTVSPRYCASILEAIHRDSPDIVGFQVRKFVDGQLREVQTHSLVAPGIKRIPSHLNPVRREVALAVGFRPLAEDEDADYSQRMHAMFGNTLRESYIDEPMYDYLYRSPWLRDA